MKSVNILRIGGIEICIAGSRNSDRDAPAKRIETAGGVGNNQAWIISA